MNSDISRVFVLVDLAVKIELLSRLDLIYKCLCFLLRAQELQKLKMSRFGNNMDVEDDRLTINALPEEVFTEIFSYLSPKSLKLQCLVCTK